MQGSKDPDQYQYITDPNSFPNCTGPAEQLQPRAAALPGCQANRAGPAQDPPQQQTLRVTTFLRSVFYFLNILKKVLLHRKMKKIYSK